MLKNNDFKLKFIIMSFAFCMVLILSVFLNSSVTGADQTANAAAGSADDPLVTLSYINKVFKPQIEQFVADKLKDFKPAAPAATTTTTPTPVETKPAPTEPPVQNTYIMSAEASVSYVVVELTKGQKLGVKSGSLELILRPGGTAAVISQFKTQGIADLTTGDELLNGKSLPINHSLLIPRADGRGISITSVIAYVMVRGDYEIFD